LGTYRVRDFDDPVELWQVAAPGLDDAHPALRVLPADRHNLSTPPTPIVGREFELIHLAELTHAGRIVSIVGLGGVGKTRLATEHGFRSLDEWPDGVWFVDLSTIDDGALAPAAVARSLGVRTPPDSDDITEIVGRLTGKRALLILDNVEQIRSTMAKLAAEIVARCSSVGVVATSREPLGLRAESVLRLGPLGVTANDAGARPAVELFLVRAAEAGAVGRTESPAVEQLCRRLDGLPLAIEMAAARAGVLSPEEILAGLDREAQTFAFASDDPTLAERHRSLDDLLAWSDRLLNDRERTAVRRLAAFVGSFGYETAAAAIGSDEAADLVWSLANKSLLDVDVTAGATRYRFPETVRTFARRHDPDHDVVAAACGLADWYLARIGPDRALDTAWVARMGEDVDNIRGLIWLVASDEPATAQRLAWAIGMHHDLVQAYRHGIDELAHYAETLPSRTTARVGLLTLLADLRLRVGDAARAAEALAAARELREEVGPAPWDDVAIERTEGQLAVMAGDHDRAARIAEDALERTQSDRGRGRMSNLLGLCRYNVGDHVAAAAAFRSELAAWERLGVEPLQVGAHGNIAEVLLRIGDRAGAAHHQRRCMRLASQYGQPALIGYSMMIAARLASDEERWQEAVRLQFAADARIAEIGVVMYPADREPADALLAACRARLDAERYESERQLATTGELGPLLALADEIFAAVESQRLETHV
jgi:predicted ATPase